MGITQLNPAGSGEEVASKLYLGGRWRKLYGNGKLKDPNNGDISEEIYEQVKLDYSEQYQSNLQGTVNKYVNHGTKMVGKGIFSSRHGGCPFSKYFQILYIFA